MNNSQPKAPFKKSDEALARFAKALSAPAKAAILRTLAARDSCVCGEIVDITPLAQSTVSQHLKELKELGLVQGRIEGVKSCYCLNPSGIAKLRAAFESFFSEIDAAEKCCAKKSTTKETHEKRRT